MRFLESDLRRVLLLGVTVATFSLAGSAMANNGPVATRSVELPYFVHNHDARFRGKARVSGDGTKLVLVRQPSSATAGYALTTWLRGVGEIPPGSSDLPEVFLYALDTGALKRIFVGSHATRQDDGGDHYLTQLNDTVSADLNYDGSRVVVGFTDHRMTYSATGVAESLLVDSVIQLIDTSNGATVFEKRLPAGSIFPKGLAMRLNREGTRAAFLHYPRGALPSSVFGVTYFGEAPAQIYSLALSGNAEPTQLSEGDGASVPKLHDFQAYQSAHFNFDLDATGDRVVFNYAQPAQVIGINFDGTDRHVISTNSDNPFVALTRDGDHVVYSFFGAAATSEDDASYVNSFPGTAERILIQRDIERSRFTRVGQLIPGDDATDLAYSVDREGGLYRPVPTEAAITINWWGGTLIDASDDLKVVLTESVPVGGSQFSSVRTYYISQIDPDSDRDGLGDNWEQLHFGNLAEDVSGDNDGDGFGNAAEYQLGTNPKNKDSDGDGLDDVTEFNRTGTDPLDARSGLAIEPATLADGKLRLRWNTVNAKSYRIQSSVNLGAAVMWENISESIVGNGQSSEFNATPPTDSGAVFYRIALD